MTATPTAPAASGVSTDLLYSDVEDSLRDSLRSLLDDRCPPESVTARYDGAAPDPALWRAVARELGLAGLLVPEELGGAGATAREAAVVLEELGRYVAPVPFLTSAVLATTALLEAGEDRLLPRLAAGEATAVLAVPLSWAPGDVRPSVRRGDDGRLRGRVSSVADADVADALLVPVDTSGGVELHRVPRDAAGVSVDPVVSLDMSRPLSDVALDAVEADFVTGDGAACVQAALLTGAALLASEQLGVAEWCLQSTVAYVRERKQFGRPVGSFQALKHRLADVWLEVGSARAAARYTAGAVADRTGDLAVGALLAQAYCAGVAVHAAEECVQLHGGIGMTWEHPAHLFLKRAKADAIALGTAERHRALLGELVDLRV
ncbi:MAG: acyl-CoA/acyl-ACP dehydrogenase [Actinomycetota bacterium]|nr:acyl-CoA/acyl-ACP dehydrogenase [Actinomycetota bacterium]